jgi:hypothetical protein
MDSYNSQLALFTTERQRDLRPAVAFLKNLLKTYACVNSRKFHEVELNFLLLNLLGLIRFISMFHLFLIILNFYSNFIILKWP